MARIGLVAPIFQFWDRHSNRLVAEFDHALLAKDTKHLSWCSANNSKRQGCGDRKNSEKLRNAGTKGPNVIAHCGLGLIRIVFADGRKDRAVLLLHPLILLRRIQ